MVDCDARLAQYPDDSAVMVSRIRDAAIETDSALVCLLPPVEGMAFTFLYSDMAGRSEVTLHLNYEGEGAMLSDFEGRWLEFARLAQKFCGVRQILFTNEQDAMVAEFVWFDDWELSGIVVSEVSDAEN